MKDTKSVNQPRVIAVIIMITGLLLFMVIKPIFSSNENKNVRLVKINENMLPFKDLPKNYSDIKAVKAVDEEKQSNLDQIIPDEPVLDIIPKKTIVCENIIVEPAKKIPTEIEKANAKAKVAPIGFPSFKPAKQTPKENKENSIKAARQKPGSRYLIQAGSTISAITVTGINSDLPGHVVARIDRGIYDSISGRYLLIPQGSTLLGSYDSNIKLNQKRVSVSWKQIKLSDGSTVDLGKGMHGVGIHGMAGVKGSIDNNYFGNMVSIFSVALLNSSAKQINNSSSGSMGGEVSGEVSGDVADAGSEIFKRQIKLGPVITIPMGEPVKVLVTKDLVFEEPYNAKTF